MKNVALGIRQLLGSFSGLLANALNTLLFFRTAAGCFEASVRART